MRRRYMIAVVAAVGVTSLACTETPAQARRRLCRGAAESLERFPGEDDAARDARREYLREQFTCSGLAATIGGPLCPASGYREALYLYGGGISARTRARPDYCPELERAITPPDAIEVCDAGFCSYVRIEDVGSAGRPHLIAP